MHTWSIVDNGPMRSSVNFKSWWGQSSLDGLVGHRGRCMSSAFHGGTTREGKMAVMEERGQCGEPEMHKVNGHNQAQGPFHKWQHVPWPPKWLILHGTKWEVGLPPENSVSQPGLSCWSIDGTQQALSEIGGIREKAWLVARRSVMATVEVIWPWICHGEGHLNWGLASLLLQVSGERGRRFPRLVFQGQKGGRGRSPKRVAGDGWTDEMEVGCHRELNHSFFYFLFFILFYRLCMYTAIAVSGEISAHRPHVPTWQGYDPWPNAYTPCRCMSRCILNIAFLLFLYQVMFRNSHRELRVHLSHRSAIPMSIYPPLWTWPSLGLVVVSTWISNQRKSRWYQVEVFWHPKWE